MLFLAELYWQFCNDLNHEDTSGLKSFETPGGKIEVSEAEARIFAYLESGCGIKVAYYGDVMIGFLIYQKIFESLYSIRCMFTEPLEGLKLGKRLVNSLQPKHLIFQSQKASPPEKCLEVTKPFRKKIAEDDNFETWLMPWRV